MLAVEVEKRVAEPVRARLLKAGLYDRGRKIVSDGGFVEIPVLEGKLPLDGYSYHLVEQRDSQPRGGRGSPAFGEVRALLREEFGPGAEAFRGGWEMVGDILIVQLPEGLRGERARVGRRLMELLPRAKAVLHREGIGEVFRRPLVEVIAGEVGETVHLENSCLYRLDPTRVMFSAGNMGERRRMAHISSPGEVVLDMFAGIGQFTIPLARHSMPRRVVAVEKNPVAHGYLRENIRLNGLGNVEAILGDCREAAPRGVADRVIMGYLFDTQGFLPTAVGALGRKGIIHFHTLSTKKGLAALQRKVLVSLERLGTKPRLLGSRFVKSYSPSHWHAVLDIEAVKS
ncbi:MAG: class I SAM-dependent methyltransferase family protein [Euryarchaeota archaeon]|nr:class I SAM-dependent methyltransferase family protein [Euryarchaeota archaeon]